MQPSPPKALRTRKTLNRPFYEIHTKSSAEIVSEARSLIRPLDTKRPFTPLDLLPRMLIPDASYKIDRRPPSGSRYIYIYRNLIYKYIYSQAYTSTYILTGLFLLMYIMLFIFIFNYFFM